MVLFGKEHESVPGLPREKEFNLNGLAHALNPSTKYLRIHATCGHIAHYSGAIQWRTDGVSRVIPVGDHRDDDDVYHEVKAISFNGELIPLPNDYD